MTAPSVRPDLLDEASRCVACGLCVPHCPTYRKTLSEADSPRGRIALMRGMLEGSLPLGERLVGHLDLCLGCRACENACPSGVEYGRLLDGVRAEIEPQHARPLRQAMLRRAAMFGMARPELLERAAFLLRKRPGAALRLSRAVYPAVGRRRGEVGLFLGCAARVSDAETLSSAILVLNRLGYTVHVPRDQTCCGALHQHEGEPDKARSLARQNLRAFAGIKMDAVIHAASACGATLRDYARDIGAFPAAVLEICAFLSQAEGWEDAQIAPLDAAIAVHEPCSLRNVLRGEKAPYALLRRIPGATVAALPGNDQCCGAAGLYRFSQPDMAQQLLDDKIAAIRSAGARCIATTNPGCALHMAAGLRAAGIAVEVLHPVTLLARQMKEKT